MNPKEIIREKLASQIVDIAFQIHWRLGPGLLESIYEKCFCFELRDRNIEYLVQKRVPIIYKSIKLEDGLRLDLLIEDCIIVELKAQEIYNPIWEAQLLSYMRLSGKELVFIINFTVPAIKNGIKRMILSS